MRTDLPTTSALIKLVYLDSRGETKERTEYMLIVDETKDHITCITMTGVTRFYSKYRGVVSENPTVKSVEVVDSDSDEYQELVTTIQIADMTEALDLLAGKVSREFRHIISICPVTEKDLMDRLSELVLGEEE